jgi:MFS family permease
MAVMKDKTSFRQDIFSHDWVVVGAFTLVMAGFYGAEISFSVFLKPLIAEFGWTRAGVSGSVSTVEGTAGLVGILMGTLTDKYGARILIAIGGILGGLGYLLMSQVSSLWQLYLYFGVMVGMCLAGCWTPIMATVARLFREKRVLALGIAMSGITVGSMIMPPMTAYFIASYGWRHAYLVLAAIVGLSAIPGVMLLGKNPLQDLGTRDNGQNMKGGELSGELTQPREHLALESVKTVPFWMLMITGFATAAGFYFVATHIVAFATDMGIAPTSAALILTFMGAGNILGKLLVGSMAAKIGSRSALFVLLTLQALFLFLIMRTTSLWMLFALGSVFGFGYGGSSPIRTAMVPEFFGTKSVGAIIGLVGIAWGVGGVVGPFMAGYIFDQSGSYDRAFLSGGLIMIIGMAATYFLKAPKA